ncbi:SRPBCC family protein [Actinoplanes sp. TRM 88003]|uniref:SRPBCC family protein n=1 Tax=Paractinoplanes aksuensis TaxID=2939490 RepID=A0ABT1DSR1_9ACTN|nr:SRPBCC family protein [Actinoplanes aksuensis]MCO8273894.1 SRPBCC family protein [Actinoplanes aksuensis]
MTVDVDRAALIVAEHATTVDAPLDTVWRLQTTVGDWPSWQPDITAATLDGPFAPGSVIRWRTHGMDIPSTIREVVPGERIVWGGTSQGIVGVHVWTFAEGADGVTVRTVESWDGPTVAADQEGMRAALSASLVGWLAALAAAVTAVRP